MGASGRPRYTGPKPDCSIEAAGPAAASARCCVQGERSSGSEDNWRMGADEDPLREFDGVTLLTAEQREACEQACLGEARSQLTVVTSARDEPHKLVGVELDGHHPDTCIRVVLFDPRVGEERAHVYALWRSRRTGEAQFLGHRRTRESPYTVGMLIAAWAQGG
jgi:hypothetical protein